jgi:putative ABC transport system substrate-binding protein
MLAMSGAMPEAQQTKKVPRIGYLSSVDPATDSLRAVAVRHALRDLGYIEGQNIATEYRYAEGKRDRFPELAAELVRLKVDVLVVAGGNTPVRAVKNATKRFRSLWQADSIPSRQGWSKAFCPSGRQRHRPYNLARELGGKRLELLKEAVPKLARVAVLYDSVNPSHVSEVKEVLPMTAGALKLTIQPWVVPGPDGFERAFAAFNKERLDGLYVLSGTRVWAIYKRIAGFALKSRLPSIYNNTEAVDAGGLMFYGADVVDSYPSGRCLRW